MPGFGITTNSCLSLWVVMGFSEREVEHKKHGATQKSQEWYGSPNYSLDGESEEAYSCCES